MTDANPFQPRSRGRYDVAIAAVKAWTISAMELGPEDRVSVTELACRVPGCAPQETVIVAMPSKGHWLKCSVHKAMPDVVEQDVLWALRHSERVARPRSA
jgi:hypothetical protein